MSTAKLAFGVEIEVLLQPRSKMLALLEKAHKGWAVKLEEVKKAQVAVEGKGEAAEKGPKGNAEAIRVIFRQTIADILTREYDMESVIKSRDFRQWSVTDEPTLTEMAGYCKLAQLFSVAFLPITPNKSPRK